MIKVVDTLEARKAESVRGSTLCWEAIAILRSCSMLQKNRAAAVVDTHAKAFDPG